MPQALVRGPDRALVRELVREPQVQARVLDPERARVQVRVQVRGPGHRMLAVGLRFR